MLFKPMHYTPNMHHKLIEHGRCCMKDNELQSKTNVELESN